MYGWFDFTTLPGQTRTPAVNSVISKAALPGGISSPSISSRPQWAGTHIPYQPYF